MAITEQKVKEQRAEHSELALKFLREKRLDRGDVIQASEKLYKAAEEAVKGLAEVYASDVCEEAMRRGRWTVRLLESAMDELVRELDGEIRASWDAAWFLHVEGFHETRIDTNSVRSRLESVKKLVERVQN